MENKSETKVLIQKYIEDRKEWGKYVLFEAPQDMIWACEDAGALGLPAACVKSFIEGEITIREEGFIYFQNLPGSPRLIGKEFFAVPDIETVQRIVNMYFDEFSEFLDEIESKRTEVTYSRKKETRIENGKVSVIDCSRNIVQAFYGNFQYSNVYQYTPELIDRLKSNIDTLMSEYLRGNFDRKRASLYSSAVTDGENILSRLVPFKPRIIEFD